MQITKVLFPATSECFRWTHNAFDGERRSKICGARSYARRNDSNEFNYRFTAVPTPDESEEEKKSLCITIEKKSFELIFTPR